MDANTMPNDFRADAPHHHSGQYIGLLVIGILLGAGASFAYFKWAGNASYQAGFDAAKKLVEHSSLGGMLQTPSDVRVLSGVVSAVSGNQFTLHTQLTDPFADPALVDRTVLISPSTTIVKLVQKDPKVFQSEMDAFIKANQAKSGSTQTGTPPSPFSRIPATSADIAVNAVVTVVAAENINTAGSFTASQIQIQIQPGTPAATSGSTHK